MSKVWYINLGQKHLGPFSREDIFARLHTKKITLKTPVWKNGMAAWVVLEQCHDFFPPEPTAPVVEIDELPPIPLSEEPVLLPSLPALPEPEDKDEEELHPAALPVEEKPIEKQHNGSVEPKKTEDEGEGEVAVPVTLCPIRRNVFYWKVSLSIIPFLVFFLWWALLTTPRPAQLPAGLVMPQVGKQLLEIIHQAGDKPVFTLVMSSDQKKLVLAGNYPGLAEVHLTLSSYRDKVVSSSPSVLTSSATLENHLAIFSDLRIEEGEGMVPGLYMAQVRGVKTGFSIRLLKLLRQIPFIRSWAFTQELDDRLHYRGDLLLLLESEQQLHEALTQYKQKLKRDQSKPLLELIERYRTYGAIVEMLNTLFRESLKRFREPGSIHLFEKDYVKKISPLYQSITVENQKIQVSLLETNEQLSQEYQKLVEFGRQIGQLVIEINDRMKKYRKLKSKNRLELLVLFQGRLNELEELSKMRIHRLQEKLSDK